MFASNFSLRGQFSRPLDHILVRQDPWIKRRQVTAPAFRAGLFIVRDVPNLSSQDNGNINTPRTTSTKLRARALP